MLYPFAERGSTQVQKTIYTLYFILHYTINVDFVFMLMGMCLQRMKAYCCVDCMPCDGFGMKLNYSVLLRTTSALFYHAHPPSGHCGETVATVTQMFDNSTPLRFELLLQVTP